MSPDRPDEDEPLANQRTEPERPLPDPAGSMIDRYVIVSELGSGAMGRVYLAVDPELDRRVAIKLLRRLGPIGDRDLRLRREAQALAKVTHPSVAAIYDVGEVDGNLFLAMEYVPGGTLTKWLRATRRPWQDIVRVFAAAARGLAAVHARGLVHRDFKPDNVLLDDKGHAKVTDFGLVATFAEQRPTDSDLGSAEGVEMFGSLTMTGAVIGTPAYMSPEQFAGRAIDARSDQFSFSVSLYEALYGVRPFSGASPKELEAALTRPPPEPSAAARRGAPRWLHQVILRGLAHDPDQRFPSMDALVDVLDLDRRRRRRVALGAFAGLALVGGLAATWVSARDAVPSCAAMADEIESTWSPERRLALETAFVGTKLTYAKAASTGVATTLDRYADAWRARQLEVCEATRVKQVQTIETMELRTSCLAAKRRELGSLLQTFAEPTPVIIEHALDAAAELSPIEECDDVARLAGAVPAPSDPDARGEIALAREGLVRAKVWTESGMIVAAASVIDTQLAVAKRLHYAPLEAEALLSRAVLEDEMREHVRSAATYRAAAAAADRSRDDKLRFKAWANLVGALTAMGKLADAEAQIATAEAALDRAGHHPDLVQRWAVTRAQVHYFRGEIAQAEKLYDGAIAKARARGDRRSVGEILYSEVLTLLDVAPPDKLLPMAEEAYAIAVAEYGREHPEPARREKAIARVLTMQDRYEEAHGKIEHALGVLVQAYGPEHTDVATVEMTLATVLRRLGKPDVAKATLEGAIAKLRKTQGDKHFWVADGLMSLALIERREKAFAKALEHALEAKAILEETLGPQTDGLVAVHHTIGMLYRDMNKPADAQRTYEAGLALGEKIAPKNPRLGLFLAELGNLRFEADDAAGAEGYLTRAVAAMEQGGSSPESLAFMRLDLAHAKAFLGKWPEAVALAKEARAALKAPPDLAEVDALLKKASKHVR